MQTLMSILYIITAVLFLAYPESSAYAASAAVEALENVVVRSLFPMMVLSRLIASSSLIKKFTAVFAKSPLWKRLCLSDALLPAVLTGLISGIPSSARPIAELRREGVISAEEAKKALALSLLPSPAFVILVASPNIKIGLFRYLLLVFAAYQVSSLFFSEKSIGESRGWTATFSSALSSSVSSALTVSGSIIFFTSMTCLSASLFPSLSKWAAALFEMGSGVVFANGEPVPICLAIGWCGISSMAQIKSEAPEVSLVPYISARGASSILLILSEFSPAFAFVVVIFGTKMIKIFTKFFKRPCKLRTLDI